MGAMEKCCRSKCTGGSRSIETAILNREGMIQQTPNKGKPGLGDQGARSQDLPVCAAQWKLARFVQDPIDNFERDGGYVLRRTGDCLRS